MSKRALHTSSSRRWDWRIFALFLPVVLLVFLALVFQSPQTPTLRYEKQQVSRVETFKTSGRGRIAYRGIELLLRYDEGTPLRVWSASATTLPELEEAPYYLVDATGRRYPISSLGNWGRTLSPVGTQYVIELDVPIGAVPSSKGKLVLKGRFSTATGAKLPLSVVVRDK